VSPVGLVGDIADVGLGRCDVRPGGPVDQAGEVEDGHAACPWQGCRPCTEPPAKRASEDEQDERQDRPELTQQKDRSSADPIGKAPQPRGGQELRPEEGRRQQGDLEHGPVELALGIQRQNWQDHTGAEDICEDHQQDGVQGPQFHHRNPATPSGRSLESCHVGPVP
jgi:hypothetical protein